MNWMLIGTLCLLTNVGDLGSLSCVRVASEIKFANYDACNEYSLLIVDEFSTEVQKYPGQKIEFYCVPYQSIKLKGTEI